MDTGLLGTLTARHYSTFWLRWTAIETPGLPTAFALPEPRRILDAST